jgi:V/A-type H+-transporting ATPase subunit D
MTMAKQAPPGRAGRAWLLERIATATHGIDLLGKKQQLLSRERRRLVQHLEEASGEWATAQAEAELWSTRAGALGGASSTRLAGAQTSGRAEVSISWRNTMGVVHPDEARVTPAPLDATDLASFNAAVGPSALAHRRALGAAARLGVARSALGAVEAELASTRRRLRAIERDRLPWLKAELHTLVLALDEVEREERLFTRWAAQRSEQGVTP